MKEEDREKFATGDGLNILAQLPGSQHDVLVGRRLGDYDITGFIAEGGMSRVYAATRSDGSFERDVAIKVSPVSSLSPNMRDRFLQEQAVLATLNHPHITQLYDAHVTEEGWPYIVMEHIDGTPLTEHCRTHGLDIQDRVRLFIDVVDAVSYAHARLVIHRDIKPRNVLVDTQGGIKLLDFGIAKLMESDATQTTAGPMTPRYASPEQLLGETITVTSDIYQLGLLLAEVLLEKPLIDDETLTAAIERAAGRIPVTLPLDDKRRLPKDLVQVIEQCLRANPDERYAAANELHDDLTAYLQGYPVQAAGQSASYRFKKLVSRHKIASVVSSVTLIAGISAVAWYTWQLNDARKEAEVSALQAAQEATRANQVAEFLKELLAAAKPSNARGEEVTVRQVLDAGVEQVRSELQEPALKASLLEIMGDVYTDLGDFQQAEQLLLESIEIHRETGDPLALAQSLNEFGQLLRTRGDWQAAIPVMEEALVQARQVPGDESLEVQGNILNSLGFGSSKLNRFADAESYHRQALALRRELYGPEDVVTSQSLSSLGFLLYKMGQYDESLEKMEAALRIADKELGPYHPVIATRALNLSSGYLRTGRYSEAEDLVRKAIEVDEYVYGPDHYYIASGLLNLAAVYREQQDFERAATTAEQALAIETSTLGDRHVDTGNTRTSLAYYYTRLGNYEAAEELIAIAEEIFDQAELGEHNYVLQLLRTRGALMHATASYPEALAFYEEALEMATQMFGPDHHRVDLLAGAARANAAMNHLEPASRLYAKTIDLIQSDPSGWGSALIRLRREYADVLEKRGEPEKAQAIRDETSALVELASQ